MLSVVVKFRISEILIFDLTGGLPLAETWI
jgi:hypothetical protein